MSTQFKTSLLAASAIIAAAATPAHAQLIFPAAELHAAGATSIQDVMPREANCIGDYNTVTGTAVNSYARTASDTYSARSVQATQGGVTKFDCATNNIQPNILMKYIAVGSTAGRGSLVADSGVASQRVIAGTTSGTPVGPNTSVFGSNLTNWNLPHFIMTDAPLLQSEVDTWTTNRAKTADAGKGARALIQIPLYVLPISVAYSPVYGYKEGTTPGTFDKALTLNIKAPNGDLRLSKHAYCGIFNGYITNWNDTLIQETNQPDLKPLKVPTAATALFDPTNDTSSRWASEGAPIRLVGRLDGSGSTDIFTRHIFAACNSSIMQRFGAPRITRAAEQVPYIQSSTSLDMTTALSTTNFKPTTGTPSTSRYAGDFNMITGSYWNNAASTIDATATGESISYTAGSKINGTGKFILAEGGSGVAKTISAKNPANAGVLITAGDIKFNGKIGYVSQDTVLANPSLNLKTASLEAGYSYNRGAGKKWLFNQPTAANATLAFGGVLPPESTAKGAYVAGSDSVVSRTNPLGWYNALYVNSSTLANPAVGYAMTGTTQFITGSCFADRATRNAVVALLTTLYGVNVTNSAGAKFNKILFTGAKAGALGIRQDQGLAQLPAAWVTAINETFLKKSKDAAVAGLNLWIQNGLPTEKSFVTKTAKGSAVTLANLAAFDARTGYPATTSVAGDTPGAGNPACTAGEGLPTQ